MLTDTNMFSLTFLNASGNTNPADPAHTVQPNGDFNANLTLVGYSRSFALCDRTALGSILVPVGNLEGEVTGPVSWQGSARGFGDPVLQFDLNLIGTPAMRNMPALMRYDPCYTVDFVLNLGVPIGEYNKDSPVNIGQNRWFGRAGVPVMINLGDWVPGRRTTFEFLPAVWFFADNDDFLGQTMKNAPLFQFDAHLTRDFTPTFWGSLDAVWYNGAESTIAGLSGGSLNAVAVGFTLGYQINDNLMLTGGYTATVGDGPGDLDLGVFRVNLIYGWHELFEGIGRLSKAGGM